MTEEKVELVKEYQGEYGLNTCLAALELPKSTWYYQKKEKVVYEEKYEGLKRPVLDVIRENPGYGYRRILPELYARGHRVGEFVVRRMLKHWDLELLRTIKKPRLSGPRRYLQQGKGWNLVQKIEDPQALQVLYTDFTEIRYAEGNKKAYLMPIIDHKTKLVIGWGVAERKNTALALGALSMAHTNLDAMGMSLEDRFIHHDQDTVYTGYRWLQAVLIRERARISFSENGARGNTYMESFNGHFKGESGGLFFDAKNMWELRRALAEQIEYYNVQRRHSALGYVSPWTYIKQEVTLPQPALDLAQISS